MEQEDYYKKQKREKEESRVAKLNATIEQEKAFSPKLLYKCPGRHKASYGICYDFRGAKNQKELELGLQMGFFETLQEAAEAVGERAFIKKKIKHKPIKKRTGHPWAPPVKKVEESVSINESEKVDVIVEPEITIEESSEVQQETDKIDLNVSNIEKIKAILKDSKGVQDAAKKLGVSWQSLNAFKKKNELD